MLPLLVDWQFSGLFLHRYWRLVFWTWHNHDFTHPSKTPERRLASLIRTSLHDNLSVNYRVSLKLPSEYDACNAAKLPSYNSNAIPTLSPSSQYAAQQQQQCCIPYLLKNSSLIFKMIPANIHASSSGTLSRLLETHQSTSSSRNRSSPICNHIFLIPFFIFLWLACLFSCHARFEIPTGAQRAWLRLPPFQLVTLFPFLLGHLFSCLLVSKSQLAPDFLYASHPLSVSEL